MHHSPTAAVRWFLFFVAIGAAALPLPVRAQESTSPVAPGAAPVLVPVAPATVARDGMGRAAVRAVRIHEPMALDGQLTEPAYGQVPPIDGFIQQEPREGQPATQKTDAWLFYDNVNIYVAARCWSTDPARIVANEMRRDGFAIFQNDHFGVFFDTFHDRRNGLFFYTNALGALSDQAVTDERDTNRDWNTVWDVRTARFDQGWTVEIVIPFRSLRYASPGPQIWGVQFRRVARAMNEVSYLTAMPAAFTQRAITHVSYAGTLVGLETPPSSLNLEMKPYAVGSVQTDLGGALPVRNEAGGDVGFDTKYTLKNGLVADLTVNTDFAQVEDDEQQVNLTPFGLYFPERRDFFLEGAGIFSFGGASLSPRPGNQGPPSNTPILFYSRRIGLFEHADDESVAVPILAGGRVTGRVGKYTVGLLDIQQRASTSVGAPATNFGVVRVKRDILKQSSVGLLFTNRSRATDTPGSSQTYGLDAAFTFHRDITINSYYAKTKSEGLDGRNASYRADILYMGDRYGFELEHLTVQEHFRPESGFLRRENFRRNFGTVRFSPRPKAPSAVRKYQFEAGFDHFTDNDGRLQTQQAQLSLGMDLQNGDEWRVEATNNFEHLSEAFEIASGVLLPVGGYRYNEVEARYQLGPQRRLTGSLYAGGGQFFDGTRTQVGYRGRIELTPKLGIEPGIAFNWVDLKEGAFLAKLLTARLNYNVSPRQAFSALVQYNSAGNVVGANARFRWEFKPGSDFFVVYNEGRDTEFGVRRSELRNRTFAVKVTRLFRF